MDYQMIDDPYDSIHEETKSRNQKLWEYMEHVRFEKGERYIVAWNPEEEQSFRKGATFPKVEMRYMLRGKCLPLGTILFNTERESYVTVHPYKTKGEEKHCVVDTSPNELAAAGLYDA